jgi:hypothetical protein
MVCNNDDDTNHQHETEHCIPLCACACCGHIFATPLQFNKIVFVKIYEVPQQYFSYKSISVPSDFYGNIWQPPKLS